MTDNEETKPTMAPEDSGPGYEKRDIRVRPVLYGFLVGIVFIALVIAGLDLFYDYTEERVYYENVLSVPNPRLQEIHAEEERILTSYEVLDEEAGIVRIPVDRAMRLLVEEAD